MLCWYYGSLMIESSEEETGSFSSANEQWFPRDHFGLFIPELLLLLLLLFI